jgi:hypothetical protein
MLYKKRFQHARHRATAHSRLACQHYKFTNQRVGGIMRRLALVLGACLALSVFAVVPGFAAPIIAVDENGHSQVTGVPGLSALPFALLPDPGPGGAPAALTYTLPFTTAIGDVTFVSSSDPFIVFGGDVVRFNGDTLVFYSDTVPHNGPESLADTFAPPGALYANVATATEMGSDENNRALYTPLFGQPGFADSLPSYVLISDGVVSVPEPSTLPLLGSGLGGVVLLGRRKSLGRVDVQQFRIYAVTGLGRVHRTEEAVNRAVRGLASKGVLPRVRASRITSSEIPAAAGADPGRSNDTAQSKDGPRTARTSRPHGRAAHGGPAAPPAFSGHRT